MLNRVSPGLSDQFFGFTISIHHFLYNMVIPPEISMDANYPNQIKQSIRQPLMNEQSKKQKIPNSISLYLRKSITQSRENCNKPVTDIRCVFMRKGMRQIIIHSIRSTISADMELCCSTQQATTPCSEKITSFKTRRRRRREITVLPEQMSESRKALVEDDKCVRRSRAVAGRRSRKEK